MAELAKLTEGINKALERSSDTGELKGRLFSLETRVQHQETRTDARFDKMEAKVDNGFKNLMDVVVEVKTSIADLVLTRAKTEGRDSGVVKTVTVVSTIIGVIFGVIQFVLVLWFKTRGG